MRGPFHSLLQIRIVKDDIRTLPSQFERDVLQIRCRRRSHDFPSDQQRTRERDFFDQRVLADRLADDRSVPVHDVNHTGREPSIVEQRRHAESSQRSYFRGLDDDRVARRKCRGDFPDEHEDCKLIGIQRMISDLSCGGVAD